MLLLMQELSAARTDMATVVEGFFNGTFGSKGIDRDGLVVRFRCGPWPSVYSWSSTTAPVCHSACCPVCG